MTSRTAAARADRRKRAPSPRPHAPSEAAVATLWEEQRLPVEALLLDDGRPIRVVYRGRRNRGPGPDFVDAAIVFPGEQLRYGDVEIHVNESDWRSHGHDGDPAYGRVILHVVYEPSPRLVLAERPPVMALGPWVRRRAGDIEALLAGEALAPDPWREPCHAARQTMGDATLLTTLRRLGVRRFRERAAAIAAAVAAMEGGGSPEERDEVLHRLIMEALGYPRNTNAFARLAELAPWAALRSSLGAAPQQERTEHAEALLLARAGLLSVVPDERARFRLSRLAQGMGVEARMATGAWRRWGLRPDNRPERRVAAAAALAARFVEGGPASLLAREGERSVHALLDALTVGPRSTWGRAALVGRGRAIEIATNAVLPYLAAAATLDGDDVARELAERRFIELPGPGTYGRTAELARALGGGGRGSMAGAAGQQALLYLQEHYCSRGRCGRCPVS